MDVSVLLVFKGGTKRFMGKGDFEVIREKRVRGKGGGRTPPWEKK